MIKFIRTEQTYELRSLVLRNGLPIETCHFDLDEHPSTFHIGYFEDKQLLCIVTFVRASYKESSKDQNQYQLRGMATAPSYRSKGLGHKVLNFGLSEPQARGVKQVWCNARTSAKHFYQKNRFIVDSEPFIIETAAPHIKMIHHIR